jgi:3-hydroxyisobutyrate dehydrogenase-like beta-hydroxyacid dehydrogenase
MRVGLIGAGRMGRPMMQRLIQSGHEVCVLARSDASRLALAAGGATVVTDAAAVGAGAEVVLVCVFTDEQVRDACLHTGLLGAMQPGCVVVLHTTGSPRTAEAVAATAARSGVGVVDAPVSGGPHDIAAGTLTLFVGGEADVVAQVRPLLSCYSDPVMHVGVLGAGQKVKLVNNALFAAQLGLVADAIRLGCELCVDEAVLLNALPHGSAASRALAGAASRGSVATFGEAVREFLSKDIAEVRSATGDLGADLGALDQAMSTLFG